MKKFKYIYALLMLCCTVVVAQQTPASKQSKDIAIVGATAHIGNGQVIENSIITFSNGKITNVADAASISVNSNTMDIIDATGKHVYPGFITSNSSLGLVEVNAVRASNDQRETGNIKPHIRSLIAYNAESKVVESMRPNGVLVAQISPKGGRISGTSSIVQFDAWNWEDAAIKVDDGIHLTWPNPYTFGRWWLGEDPGVKLSTNYTNQVEELNTLIKDSKAYLKGSKTTKNLPFEAMKGLYDGSQQLYIHVEDERGITDAIAYTKAHNIKNMVIIGGYEAHKVTDLLKANNIGVLIGHTHSLPNSSDDDYDLPYKMPKLLIDAGITVGMHTGNVSNFQTRNLPFYIGTAAREGIDKEEALKIITSNTAKLLGIDDRLGTLEVGKDATLFISEGDALDMRTNQLTHAFIGGRLISLETHQTELWKRYSNKYKN
ncbi:amidohydrolase family protein [Winogradskyella immobilis]|uniref:Amidohydrolase family protein n=1 Tax=Winogradskyella immobilis TaxID=2816852 RepID=A0ABS8EPQ8_9FLAO|nr:amidohydrolase family protein [Winogradskyella immobilis]MCC1485158.1 amidohydrolase family protein [Winogradskyella immobilis]MCG0017250.1 amidohydrolase family protein [Winogradskyella immobilis]